MQLKTDAERMKMMEDRAKEFFDTMPKTGNEQTDELMLRIVTASYSKGCLDTIETIIKAV